MTTPIRTMQDLTSLSRRAVLLPHTPPHTFTPKRTFWPKEPRLFAFKTKVHSEPSNANLAFSHGRDGRGVFRFEDADAMDDNLNRLNIPAVKIGLEVMTKSLHLEIGAPPAKGVMLITQSLTAFYLVVNRKVFLPLARHLSFHAPADVDPDTPLLPLYNTDPLPAAASAHQRLPRVAAIQDELALISAEIGFAKIPPVSFPA